jgi:anthranilate synthase component I
MVAMSFDRFCQLAENYEYIPLWLSLPGDMDTPVSLVKKLGGCIYLLESVEQGKILGRYSFIGVDQLLHLVVQGEKCTISGESGVQVKWGDPLQTVAETLKNLRVAPVPELKEFNGGAVGYLGYDLVHVFDGIPSLTEDDLELPDCRFMVAKTLIQLDHLNHEVKLIVLTPKGVDPIQNYLAGMQRLKDLATRLQSTRIIAKAPITHRHSPFKANMSQEYFTKIVERAKEYIRAGDIFQVVLSQRFSVEVSDEPFEIYRRLRGINPSPYLFYLNFDDLQLIGSSPEMLVRVSGSRVETCPIAGTRPRGGNSREDQLMAEELTQSPKEKAEHLMLVDLSRNDLGRVCKYGSIDLERFMEVERFSHVMHLVSRVQGELAPDKTALEALKVCFPAGTVSGAPKIRAMEIIEELETTRRGPYAGAIGYLSFDGNLDSCITIRTILITSGQAYIQAGAGIVAESDPDKEYEETLNKARAMFAAVNATEEENRFAIND